MRMFLLVAAAVISMAVLLIMGIRDEQHQRTTATYREVGKLLDCQPIPVAWNDFAKTRVETTRGVFIVHGAVSALKGAPVTLSSDGILFIEGNPNGNSVMGR